MPLLTHMLMGAPSCAQEVHCAVWAERGSAFAAHQSVTDVVKKGAAASDGLKAFKLCSLVPLACAACLYAPLHPAPESAYMCSCPFFFHVGCMHADEVGVHADMGMHAAVQDDCMRKVGTRACNADAHAPQSGCARCASLHVSTRRKQAGI